MRRIYVAGPMRGYPNLNFRAFDLARDRLLREWKEVISPADIGRANGMDETREQTELEVRKAMHHDLTALLHCDAIYMLVGWGASKGATLEFAVANAVGLIVIHEFEHIHAWQTLKRQEREKKEQVH